MARPIINRYIKLIQEDVAYCYNCQPWDSGECVWIYGVQTEWEDLFMENNIPEKYWEDIAENITCPFCGTQLDYFSQIGVKNKYEKNYDDHTQKWYQKNKNRFEDFYTFLEKYPYLGSTHELGQEILRSIIKLPKCNLSKKEWFRARKVSGSNIFETEDMMPPDNKKVQISEGRFNHYGQSVFYLSESEDGVAKEILGEKSGVLWVQKFKIKRLRNIIDLVSDGSWPEIPDGYHEISFGLIHQDILNTKVYRENSWKPEYFIPRYVADSIRLNNYNGIQFTSSRTYSNNLVIFNWTPKMIEPIGKPYLYTSNVEVTEKEHCIWDSNVLI